jgi:sulfatase maturation enzyme AslB (radical SAM superfamily)
MKVTLKEDLIFSCYLSTIRRGNRVVVFHRLHPEFLNFSIKEWEEIKRFKKNIDKGILKELLEKKLIISNRDIDRQELKLFEDSLNYDLNTLYLVLTRDCNLQCKYCMFSCLERSEQDKQLMSELIAKQGINLWRKLVKKFDPKQQYNIILYGGEPLLNMSVLK